MYKFDPVWSSPYTNTTQCIPLLNNILSKQIITTATYISWVVSFSNTFRVPEIRQLILLQHVCIEYNIVLDIKNSLTNAFVLIIVERGFLLNAMFSVRVWDLTNSFRAFYIILNEFSNTIIEISSAFDIQAYVSHYISCLLKTTCSLRVINRHT